MFTKLLKTGKAVLLLAIMLTSSLICFCQDPGGNPDGPPPAVPFDDHAHLVILLAGILLVSALFKKYRLQNN